MSLVGEERARLMNTKDTDTTVIRIDMQTAPSSHYINSTRFRLGVRWAIWVLGCVLVTQFSPLATANSSLGWPGETLSGNSCFGASSTFGPWDYTDPAVRRVDQRYGSWSRLRMVEGAHFTPNVEQLISGKRSGADPLGDIDYTLRAFPNHHRALWAISRYYLRRLDREGSEAMKSHEQTLKITPPECYFQRAKRFAPRDKMVSVVYGIYLHRRGMLDAALDESTSAEKALPENAELSYNLGLLYLDRGRLDLAQEYAGKARALGYPLEGLTRRIRREQKAANDGAASAD